MIKIPLLNHVEHPSRGSRDNVDTCFKSANIIRNTLAPDTAMNLYIQVVPQSKTYLLTLLCKLPRGGENQNLGGLFPFERSIGYTPNSSKAQ